VRSPALLLALVACAAPEEPSAPPPEWAYPPPAPVWQVGTLRGRFGRSQPPQDAVPTGILAAPGTAPVVPLRRPTLWTVPGDGPARGVAFGYQGIEPAIELIDVDRGAVIWRRAACVEPVIGVTATTIVCGGDKGVRGVGLDGQPRWRSTRPLLSITRARIAVGGDAPGEVIVIGADDGKEVWRVTLPAGVERANVVGSCEEEVYALAGGSLERIAEIRGKQVIAWQTAVGTAPLSIVELDCARDPIVVATRRWPAPPAGPLFAPATAPPDGALIAIAHSTGNVVARLDGVRGYWKARDGSNRIEVATEAGIDRWSRDLSGAPEALPLPALGELLDARGDRRLVRATPAIAAVLDREGVRAMIPLASGTWSQRSEEATATAVLGADAVVAALGPARGARMGADANAGSPGATVRRLALPPRERRIVRVPSRPVGVAVAAELRDLPEPVTLPRRHELAKPDTGTHGVAAIAIDPIDGGLYAVAFDREPGPTVSSTIARADLASGAWTWQRGDGCGPGAPVGLAVAAEIVVCAARGLEGTVRASSRDGIARWEWVTDAIDGVIAAGDAVVAFDADRATVLDAATGKVRGRLTSGDGAAVRAAVVAVPDHTRMIAADTTWLIAFERDRLVARLPAVEMTAVWSLGVAGVVRTIAPSGTGVVVVLDDGDAYRIDLPDGEVTPLPGLGVTWRPDGELVTADTIGGPIPGIPGPPPPLPVEPAAKPAAPPPGGRDDELPTLWHPIPPPPRLGDAWQYTLYERAGGLRARNDYALAWPVVPAPVRGPIGSPLVVASGTGLRDVLVLDPRTGDPVRQITLPEDAVAGLVFGTIVEGSPVAGAVLSNPLRVVLF